MHGLSPPLPFSPMGSSARGVLPASASPSVGRFRVSAFLAASTFSRCTLFIPIPGGHPRGEESSSHPGDFNTPPPRHGSIHHSGPLAPWPPRVTQRTPASATPSQDRTLAGRDAPPRKSLVVGESLLQSAADPASCARTPHPYLCKIPLRFLPPHQVFRGPPSTHSPSSQ